MIRVSNLDDKVECATAGATADLCLGVVLFRFGQNLEKWHKG